jgi:hypothetical protein
MKKILPLILAFNIGQCFADDSFKVLTQDMDKLNHKILKTEHILSRELPEKERDDLEKLKQNLIDIKSHFIAYNDSKGLEIAIALSEKKGWVTTNSLLHKIQTSCSIVENMEKDCFVELSNFDKFVVTRAISQSDKETLLNLMATYAKFSEAKLVLNDSFENTTNELLKNYNSSFLKEEKPLATVSLAPAGTMKSDVVKKIPSAVEKVESSDSAEVIKMALLYKYHLVGFIGALVALVAFTFFRRSSGKKRELKSFYSGIFISAKKKKLKARIFGNVNPGNIVKIRKIKMPFLALLDSSTIFNANLDVKIRNRGKKVVIDTVFHVQKTIQELSSIEAYSSFAKELEEIERSLHHFGGELSITNTFDNEGKLNGTYFTIVV